jgi:hypothetical protein
VTASFRAATQSDTAVLMLAASDGPDLDDELTVLVRHEPDYVLVTVAGLGVLAGADQAVPVAASLAELQVAAPADAEAV